MMPTAQERLSETRRKLKPSSQRGKSHIKRGIKKQLRKRMRRR